MVLKLFSCAETFAATIEEHQSVTIPCEYYFPIEFKNQDTPSCDVYLFVITEQSDFLMSLTGALPFTPAFQKMKFLKRMKISFRWKCNSLLFCWGANKAFLCIIWFIELCLTKLITVIVLQESLHCSCINFPSMLCATPDILLIQCHQWESTLQTVGIIRSFCFPWKVPQFHGNSRHIVWCLLQVYASLIQVSVACEWDMLDEAVMAEGITQRLGQRMQIVTGQWSNSVLQTLIVTNNVLKDMDCLEKIMEAMLFSKKKMSINFRRHRLCSYQLVNCHRVLTHPVPTLVG